MNKLIKHRLSYCSKQFHYNTIILLICKRPMTDLCTVAECRISSRKHITTAKYIDYPSLWIGFATLDWRRTWIYIQPKRKPTYAFSSVNLQDDKVSVVSSLKKVVTTHLQQLEIQLSSSHPTTTFFFFFFY